MSSFMPETTPRPSSLPLGNMAGMRDANDPGWDRPPFSSSPWTHPPPPSTLPGPTLYPSPLRGGEGYGSPYTQPLGAQPQMRMAPGGDLGLCVDGQGHEYHRYYSFSGMCRAIWCRPCGLCCFFLLADHKCRKCQYILKRPRYNDPTAFSA